MFSKEGRDETSREPEDKNPSDYYYDDATGYRIYNPEKEDNEEDESEDA